MSYGMPKETCNKIKRSLKGQASMLVWLPVCFWTHSWAIRPAASACRLPPVPGACSLTTVFHVSEPLCEQADLQRVHADADLCLVHAPWLQSFMFQNPCVSKQTCSECMQTPTCAWCMQSWLQSFVFQNPCVSKQTCSECMQTPTCAWCMQPDYNSADNSPLPR